MAKSRAGNTEKHAAKPHEPLFHIVKRPTIPMWKSWTIRAVAILAAFLVCGIVTFLLVGENPWICTSPCSAVPSAPAARSGS